MSELPAKVVVLLVCILSSTIFSSSKSDKVPIYIGGFFAHTGVWDCSGVLPAVEMALDHINNRSDVLANYDLRMVWNDTGCAASHGTRALFHQLFHEPTKLLLIGDGCSTATQAIAGTAYNWNLNTISYAASAPTLSNRIDYPYFYRTIMPDSMFNQARISLMQKFNWNRVGTIHGKHEIFSLTADHLLGKLQEANITVIASETFASTYPTNQIQTLKNLDAKIITVNMYSTKARRVMCEAYRNNMIGSGYIWMIVGWYEKKWWEVPDPLVTCSPEEMRNAVESSYYISTESLQISTSSELTVADITAAQYVDLLKQYMMRPKWENYVWHNDNPFGYDAAWAIALMLNASVSVLEKQNRRLEEFTYDDEDMGRVFFNLLNLTRFIGVSGPVSFRDGDRVGILQIRQLQGSCPNSTWKMYDKECFLFVAEPRSYSNAVQYCQSLGSEVGAIINESELQFVLQHLKESEQWYIGLTSKGDKFTWEDDRFSGNDWLPAGTELNNIPGDQSCVYMTSTGVWVPSDCENILAFICRKHQDFDEKLVAYFSEEEGLFNADGTVWNGERLIWPGGDTDIPLDNTPQVEITRIPVHLGIGTPLYITICVLASLGMILSVIFLAFNLRFRAQKFVRMSSPNLNNLIILGSMMVYASVFVGGLDSHLIDVEFGGIFCQLHAWLLSLGFVLAFGSMFSKTWRVHKVAAFKTPKRRVITDRQLILMVVVLLFIDICVLTTWTIYDPMDIETKQMHERDDPDVRNQKLIPYFEFCSCNHFIYWLVILYSYKALLLIFGAFLAWEIRKVDIIALNDSKLIGISVYNVIVLCTIGVSVSFVISDAPATLYIFTSGVVIFCTTMTLLIVFIPKIISVYKYPDGPPDIRKTNTRTITASTNNHDNSILKLEERLVEVEAENKRLKRAIGAKNAGLSERVMSGCGLWCSGIICGCCSDSTKELYKPSENGIDNEGLDVEGAL